MNYIGNKEKLRRSNQKIVYLKKELEKKDKIIKMLLDEREHIKNNLEVDLNKKGVYAQAKGQVSQILEYYQKNDKYFNQKIEKGE